VRRLSSPIFIGRVVELAELGDVAARAAAGRAATVVIGGEAGVGKTRFLAEFAATIGASGALVLRGGCLDLGSAVLPYAPFVEALRPLTPDLDASQPMPGGSFEATLGVLTRLAEEQPIILIVEDLHWADASTRDLFGFLARNVLHQRLLLVGSYRTDEVPRTHPLRPFLAELDRIGMHRIELPRFSRDELAAQLAAIRGETPDSAFVARIHARSDGNAFFAEELAAVDAGPTGSTLTPTLRDILQARLERLPPHARTVLGAAAILGRSVHEPLLAAVTGLPDDVLEEAVREAV
jgi:predicted ATPase